MATIEQPNLGSFGVWFGSATIGHSTITALGGCLMITETLDDADDFPFGPRPIAIQTRAKTIKHYYKML